MALEIERKWLIDPARLPFDLQQAPHRRIVQSYVSFSPQIRLRSIDDTQFILTVKRHLGNGNSESTDDARTETPNGAFDIPCLTGSANCTGNGNDIDSESGNVANDAQPETPNSPVVASIPEAANSLVREEFEFPIPRESYEHLMGKTEGRTIVKTRYVVPEHDGRAWEIDIYEEWLEGLAVAELEFAGVEEALAYPTPNWTLQDVSCDPVFRNVAMARDPAAAEALLARCAAAHAYTNRRATR